MVDVERLDSLASLLPLPGQRAYLKLDVQGYELQVLQGSEAFLPGIVVVEAELSLVPLYVGGPLYRDVVDYLADRGLHLISVEGITEEPDTGHMLQVDGVFLRASHA
jgi:hypothetical protein